MSAKKSWDVQSSRSRAVVPAPAAAPVTVRPAKRTARSRRPARRTAHSKVRRAQGIALGLLLALIVIGGVYVAWMPAFRIHAIAATGPHPEEVQSAARGTLGGTYLYLAPRDSIFFYSPNKMRRALLEAYPDISALSIKRTSFNSISITATPRASAFMWCGRTIDEPIPDGTCFDADANGLIFAQSSQSEMQASSTLRIFGQLEGAGTNGTPVRAQVVHATAMPRALRFVKAMRELGAPVSALELREDEADLWLSGPTRITYLLGKEERALQLASSALPSLNLKDHSIQYIDLRFEGKVYVKRHGE